MPNPKYRGGGNGDNLVDSGELTQVVSYPYLRGNWGGYIKYVLSNYTRMYLTDTHLRYRYGIKTYVNYLLEQQNRHDRTPELADSARNGYRFGRSSAHCARPPNSPTR